MMLSSPTIFRNKLKSQSHSIHVLQTRNRRKQDVIARLRSMAEKIPNLDGEKLLGDKDKWKKCYSEMMSRETDVERKEIFEILFQEMAVVRRRRDLHGAHHGHIWSPLMIQFCGYIRFGNGANSGMNSNMWDAEYSNTH